MIEWRFGLPPLTVRDQTANNLADVLDFSAPNLAFNTYTVSNQPSIACTNQAPSLPANDFGPLRAWARSLGFPTP
jgi:phospholipase C